MKRLTREQVQSRKAKAVRFVRDVVGDPERAEEIAAESLESYAARRKLQISNPRRSISMARRKTIEDYRQEIADLKNENAELQEENESLAGQLDEIQDILSPEEEEEEDEEGEE